MTRFIPEVTLSAAELCCQLIGKASLAAHLAGTDRDRREFNEMVAVAIELRKAMQSEDVNIEVIG